VPQKNHPSTCGTAYGKPIWRLAQRRVPAEASNTDYAARKIL